MDKERSNEVWEGGCTCRRSRLSYPAFRLTKERFVAHFSSVLMGSAHNMNDRFRNANLVGTRSIFSNTNMLHQCLVCKNWTTTHFQNISHLKSTGRIQAQYSCKEIHASTLMIIHSIQAWSCLAFHARDYLCVQAISLKPPDTGDIKFISLLPRMLEITLRARMLKPWLNDLVKWPSHLTMVK